jgi:hypothetical protein
MQYRARVVFIPAVAFRPARPSCTDTRERFPHFDARDLHSLARKCILKRVRFGVDNRRRLRLPPVEKLVTAMTN